MPTADIKITEENGNGGEATLVGRDLAAVTGWQNMPYLAMFGGNVGKSTPLDRVANEQNFDYWGNELFHPNDPAAQFNSQTEHVLNTTALNSAGRQKIETAVKEDLKFMQDFAEVEVEVTITGPEKVQIVIAVKELSNLQESEFIYIWNGVQHELTQQAA